MSIHFLLCNNCPTVVLKDTHTPWKNQGPLLCVTYTHTQTEQQHDDDDVNLHFKFTAWLLLHNHSSVTMVGSTHCLRGGLRQIGPGNHSLWPTMACFDLQHRHGSAALLSLLTVHSSAASSRRSGSRHTGSLLHKSKKGREGRGEGGSKV